jgi:hypothetical protein
MSGGFMRPEAAAILRRWREPLVALAVIALGLWIAARPGPIVQGFGWVLHVHSPVRRRPDRAAANNWPSISRRGCKPRRRLAHRHRAREVRLLPDTLKPLPYDGERSIRRCWKGCATASAGRRSRRAATHRAGKGRRQCQPRTRRAAGTVGRAAGDDPPDLRRGERTPARGARVADASAWASSVWAPRRSGGTRTCR